MGCLALTSTAQIHAASAKVDDRQGHIQPNWSMLASLLALLCLAGAQKPELSEKAVGKPEIRFTLLQLNDVYEITPISGEGGMARVKTVYERLRRRNPKTFIVVAGDFFSPSALGTAMVDGERLAGRQMVAVMNALPVRFVTFGNHEFDVSFDQLKKRMEESRFTWVSSNVLDAQNQMFPKVNASHIETIQKGGAKVRVGFFGLTIPSNPKDYVRYTDFLAAAELQVRALRPRVDVLIAITHLAYEDDLRLAEAFPEIDMIIGGHEHERHRLEIGSLAGIYKADANARSVFVHDFSFNPKSRALYIRSSLQRLTADIPEDSAVKAEVEKWVKIAFDAFRKDGFEPASKVADVTEPLHGSEASVRNRPTNLSKLIAEGMLAAAPGMDLAIYNGGSIRIDDVLLPGPLTEYDVIRVLPFGGKVWSVEMKGDLLLRALDQGLANKGTGGYLQTAGATRSTDGIWMIGSAALDSSRVYRVAMNDFLLTGNETNLGFLKRDGPGITVLAEHADVRTATITQLKKAFPSGAHFRSMLLGKTLIRSSQPSGTRAPFSTRASAFR